MKKNGRKADYSTFRSEKQGYLKKISGFLKLFAQKNNQTERKESRPIDTAALTACENEVKRLFLQNMPTAAALCRKSTDRPD